MVSVLTLGAVDHGFELRSGQTKDYKIGIRCFPAKHTTLRAMTGWHGNRIMCPCGLLFHCAIKSNSVYWASEKSGHHHHFWKNNTVFTVIWLKN
jgi:hypothetical protein